MCTTTDSSFQSSNTLNNTGVWSLIELASLYTVPLSAVNGLSRLTTTSNGRARPIRKFSNRLITFESNRNGGFEFESHLEASQVHKITDRNAMTYIPSLPYELTNVISRQTWIQPIWIFWPVTSGGTSTVASALHSMQLQIQIKIKIY